MDNKKMPRETVTQKKGMMGSLLSFFGIGKKKSPGKHGRFNPFKPKVPTGNYALPAAMQAEVRLSAIEKRERKDKARKVVHHQQKKLGHHNFA